MSDPVRPRKWQPTRLPGPWDSPGKNTAVGCHFLLQYMKGKVKVKSLSRVQLLATPWAAAHQAPPSMGLSRQEYWSGVPLPSPVVVYSFFLNIKLGDIVVHTFYAYCFFFFFVSLFYQLLTKRGVLKFPDVIIFCVFLPLILPVFASCI